MSNIGAKIHAYRPFGHIGRQVDLRHTRSHALDLDTKFFHRSPSGAAKWQLV
jgi:hypothetical protein